MNRDEKAAVIEEVARAIDDSQAVFAIDYRGISVKQSADLRARLGESGASFRVVKNRLTLRAADQAGAESLKAMLEGPTALTFVRGDAALAAKELAAFRREHGLLVFKGGTLGGDPLTADQVEAISRLPAREALYGQLVGVTASPLSGLVRGLAGLISGLASQLGQIRDQGLVGGAGAQDGDGAIGREGDGEGAPDGGGEAAYDGGDTAPESGGDAAQDGGDGAGADDAPEPPAEAPGDPVSEAAAAEEEEAAQDTAAAETPSEEPE